MEEIAVKVKNLTMNYMSFNNRPQTLKEFVVRFFKRQLKVNRFKALDNVSFEVKKGEVLGVIGHNGAGKSTLLKLVSGLFEPTNGSVETKGNVIPMLELGAGFDFELSGRENVFLNGALLGFSKEYVESKYDEIVSFSELQEFMEMPIRNYSSGMMMRLAFSIASIVVPDILIVDEILAVGDAFFQKKSKDRMIELMKSGTTVIFVSHSLDNIRQLCSHVIWLNHGKVVMDGETEEVCKAYEDSLNS